MISYRSEKILRGRMMILEGEYQFVTFVFPINPGIIRDAAGAAYSGHAILGRSHPTNEYVRGEDRTFSFTVDLDARTREFGFQKVGILYTGNDKSKQPSSFLTDQILNKSRPLEMVQAAVNFVQALRLPQKSGRIFRSFGPSSYGPPKILFVWGDRLNVRCVLKSVETVRTLFDHRLNLLQAQLNIELLEVPIRGTYFEDHIANGDRSGGILASGGKSNG